IEGQCLARQRVTVDLSAVASSVLESCGPLAQAEGVSLEAELPEGCLTRGDPDCLRVLVENLVSNAVKYNKPGGRVRVSAQTCGGEVILAVSDTGIGIPEQYQRFLFDEFFRVKTPDTDKKPGAGLGLCIVKRIVGELGGYIEVDSQVGVGTTFRIRLPAAPGPDATQAGQEETSAACATKDPDR
ncbi:MAG: HAMP domain-containing sensor histidine kinase, partial [candidate division WOR-3 bacterium]